MNLKGQDYKRQCLKYIAQDQLVAQRRTFNIIACILFVHVFLSFKKVFFLLLGEIQLEKHEKKEKTYLSTGRFGFCVFSLGFADFMIELFFKIFFFFRR